MYKISVIIPVYNAQEYLEKCLDSVCNQTLKDIEIICVNDCSTDNSLQILQDYSKKYPNLKILDCKTNSGESVARNIGINNAEGKYIAFVDNDDVVDLDFYEKLYNEAEKTGANITKAEAKEVYYDGKVSTRSVNKQIRKTGCKIYFISDWWTAIYERDFIIKNNLKLPEGVPLGGDILFLNEAVIKANKIATVDGTYYHHLMRENSGNSKILSLVKIKSSLDISTKILDNINNADINIITTEGYDYAFQSYILNVFNLAYKSSKQEVKKLCANIIIKLYNKCQRKKELDQSIGKQQFSFLIPYLHNNDIEEMERLLTTYQSLNELRLAALRLNIKKNIYKRSL